MSARFVFHEHIDIAVRPKVFAQHRTKQRQLADASPAAETLSRLVRRTRPDYFGSPIKMIGPCGPAAFEPPAASTLTAKAAAAGTGESVRNVTVAEPSG